jgi:hypothetical protein
MARVSLYAKPCCRNCGGATNTASIYECDHNAGTDKLHAIEEIDIRASYVHLAKVHLHATLVVV